MSLGFRDEQKSQTRGKWNLLAGALRLEVGCEAEVILGKIWKDGN